MRARIFGYLVLALVGVFAIGGALAADPAHVRLATTTSTVDTGLLDVLMPLFEKESGLKVDVVSVGTGAALKLGENCDADVLLVHDRPAENDFMKKGFGLFRRDVMHNEFVVVGPAGDPANVAQAKTAVDAFARIAKAGAPFVSRGDDSGTHRRELKLWKAARVDPEQKWRLSVGQGMGATLRIADEKKAYTLCDNATFAKLGPQTQLKKWLAGDRDLANFYGVIAVNPERCPHVNRAAALKFIDWLTGPAGQKALGDFKIDGQALFVPDAAP